MDDDAVVADDVLAANASIAGYESVVGDSTAIAVVVVDVVVDWTVDVKAGSGCSAHCRN